MAKDKVHKRRIIFLLQNPVDMKQMVPCKISAKGAFQLNYHNSTEFRSGDLQVKVTNNMPIITALNRDSRLDYVSNLLKVMERKFNLYGREILKT